MNLDDISSQPDDGAISDDYPSVRREAELKLAQARLEAKAARLEAEAIKLEVELERVRQKTREASPPVAQSPPVAFSPPVAPSPPAQSSPAQSPPAQSSNHNAAKSPPRAASPKPIAGPVPPSVPPTHTPVREPATRQSEAPPRNDAADDRPAQPPQSQPPQSKPSQSPSSRSGSAAVSTRTSKQPGAKPKGKGANVDRGATPARSKQPDAPPHRTTLANPETTTHGANAAAPAAKEPAQKQPKNGNAIAAVAATPTAATATASGPTATPTPGAVRKAPAATGLDQVQTQPGTQAPTGELDAEEQPARPLLARMINGAPSWLVSVVIHMVVILILAILSFSILEDKPELMIHGAVVDDTALEELSEVVLEVDEPLEVQDMTSVPVDAIDPGMADLGAMAETAPAEVSVSGVAEIESTTIGEIGQLFGEEGSGMAESGTGTSGAEFFGVKAGGRKFFFVVDSSKSMKGGKFEAACAELIYAVRRLSKEQFFYVIFFDHNAERMIFAPNRKPEPRAVRATPQNIHKLERWIGSMELELKTDPYEAMRFAVESLPDAIYLLSDGRFGGKTVPYLAANNTMEDPVDGKVPKVVVHTVGFYSQTGEALLKRIAKDYGGTYRFVPPPPKRKKK